jgi:CBS domain containing-hemolysin-like protein
MLDIPYSLLPRTLLVEGSLPVPLPLAIALFVVGLLTFALINAMEIAVVAANRFKIKAAAEAGSHRARAVEELKNEQETFFGVVVIIQNVATFLISTAGTVIAVDAFGTWGFFFGLIAIPLISTEFGEYTPKVVASRAADRFATLVALPLQWLVWAMRPLSMALAIVPNIISRGPVTQTVTEAELRMLIDIGAEERAIGEGEAQLLDRVFHFHDRRVNEIMVPRPDVTWLEKDTTLREFYEIFGESSHSRFPVYEETVDNVIGVVSVKNVLRALGEGTLQDSSPITPVIRPAIFVPETKLISELLRQMQQERQQIAIVVDEYGGVAGVVTLEGLLEEMFGNVTDELTAADVEFSKIDASTTRVDGGMTVFDVHDELQIELPEGDYETVAGLVLDQLGHIPRPGESVTVDGYRLTVEEVKGVKIESVRITKLPEKV